MKRNAPAIFCALLAAGLAAFSAWPSLDAGFVNWDDGKYAASPLVRELSAENVKKMFSAPHLGLYKPLAFLSLAADYKVHGPGPRGPHLTNVLLHAANAALAFWLCFLLTGSLPAALFAALAFAAHPMRAESVAWVSERKDVLYAFFFLLSCCLYLLRRGRAFYLASLACFALSLMAKPMGVTLPLALVLFDWMQSRQFSRAALLEKLPFFALAALFAALTLFWVSGGGQEQAIALWRRPLYAAYALLFYLHKAFVPSGLSCFYPYPEENAALGAAYYLAPLAVAALAVLAWKFLRRDRLAAGGLLFYAVCLLPVLGFAPVGRTVVADRYSYMAHIGLFMACAVCAASALRAPLMRRAAAALALCVIALFSFGQRARCAVWKNSVSLWTDAAAKDPSAALPRAKLAEAYLEAGDCRSAVETGLAAMESGVADADLVNNTAAALDRCGRREHALVLLEKSLPMYGSHPGIQYNRAVLLMRSGDVARARAGFARALELDPTLPPPPPEPQIAPN
ncbi:MAG: hypothetical protein GX410_09225 [Elusimicrobia bacterium]|nr:hypothetical protein [Elusimicrobiota bacterium]